MKMACSANEHFFQFYFIKGEMILFNTVFCAMQFQTDNDEENGWLNGWFTLNKIISAFECCLRTSGVE